MSRNRAIARRLALSSFVGVALISGCASYHPAPPTSDLVDRPKSLARLDTDAVRRELSRLSPSYSWDGASWNNLTLFAAALEASPKVKVARSALTTAAADAQAARQAPGPALTLSAEYAGNAQETSPWLYGVAGDVLLDIGGRRRGRLDTADIGLQRASYAYAGALWTLRSQIARSMVDMQFARLEGDVSQALVELRQRQFDVVERQTAAGQVSRAALELVRGELSAARSRSLAAEAAEDLAHTGLAAAVGIKPNALSRLDIQHRPRAENIPAQLDAGAISNALAMRSDILDAMAAYDLADVNYRSAIASQYPELRLSPGYIWERGLTKLPLGVSLGFPSWDLNAAAIKAAEAARTQAGDTLEEVVASARARVELAAADLHAATVALAETQERSLPIAERLARQAENEIAAGRIDRGEWAAAQAGLASARLDAIGAERRFAEAQLALEDTLHRPLSGPETLIDFSVSAQNEGQSR